MRAIIALGWRGEQEMAAALAECALRHPSDVVEGLEMPDKKFILSVQWHPEDLYEHDPAMKRLFRAFVEAANGHSA